jgi:hypothetical protein
MDPTTKTARRMGRVGLLVAFTFVGLTLPVPFLLTRPTSELEGRVSDYLLLWSIAIPSFVAFFGLYRIRRDIRDAIAGGFVICFFCILILSLSLNLGNAKAGTGSIRQLAISNFMTLVGTIVVFYFGSEAAIRVGESFVRERAQRSTAQEPAAGSGSTERPRSGNAEPDF